MRREVCREMKLCREQCEERDGQCQNRALHPDCGQRHGRAALIPVLSQCCRSECLEVGMGTPASVVSSQSPSWQAPEPRARKKASANIFKDIDLLQIQTLFRTSGDDCAEERARIICEYAEDRRIAEALIQLRRKKRSKAYHQPAPKLSSDQIGTLSVQHFSKLCIHEAGHISSTSTENDSKQQSEVTQDLHPCATKNGTATWKKTKERKSQRRISEYLHQIKR